MSTLLTYSATRLAEMIRNQETTSIDVVDAHIFRIKRVNPKINALVQSRFDAARTEAELADDLIRSNDKTNLPPFLGVPCTIKESFCLTGMPNTGGLLKRKNCIARQDATAVARLRTAGAIPLGVTNVSEMCLWMESYNPLYGKTCNAYQAHRTAGGSSGGEAAVIASGGSPFGLGSDIGGSIRMPAFFNGIFGHKPTAGLIPNTGHYPKEEEGISGISTTGPLCRHAEDLMPLLKILSGPDNIDPGCQSIPLQSTKSIQLKDLTVYNPQINPFFHVSSDLFAAQHQCIGVLKSRGASIRPIPHIKNYKIVNMWAAKIRSVSNAPFSQILGDGQAIQPLPELIKWLMRKPSHTLPALLTALFDQLPYSKKRSCAIVKEIDSLRKSLINIIGQSGIMLFPSHPTTAPRHYMPLFMPLSWGYTGLFNILGFPVTQVPLGLDKKGLPTGIQVVSIPGNDHVTIAVAQALEEIFGIITPMI
jgi:fatty acid amide hydrolase 2